MDPAINLSNSYCIIRSANIGAQIGAADIPASEDAAVGPTALNNDTDCTIGIPIILGRLVINGRTDGVANSIER